MPSAEDNILKFEAFDKSIRSPYVIYADFECLTMPIQKCDLSPENSYTSAYQQHEPSGFTMHEVSHRNMPPIEYRGADAVDVFLDSLQTKQEEILALHPNVFLHRGPCGPVHIPTCLFGFEQMLGFR
jgi:hypothetical protein